MDIPQSLRAIPVGGSAMETVRRRAIPVLGAVVLAVMIWDLYNHRDGPTIQVFYPRLYMWLFGAFAATLVWGTLKSLRAPIWRLVACSRTPRYGCACNSWNARLVPFLRSQDRIST